MPCLEVAMPKTDEKTKELLSLKLTEAFANVTKFGSDIFAIHYCEYLAGEVAIGGKLWHNKNSKPYLHMLLYCPRLSRTTKQDLVSALTRAFMEATENPEWKPVIHISEHPYDNVGIDGKLLSDTFEECKKRKFYYELPND